MRSRQLRVTFDCPVLGACSQYEVSSQITQMDADRMWARSRMPGLEAKQIATSNIVGHGCKRCIKVDLVFEFPAFTAHHIRDALRCTLAQHPYGSPEWNQEVKLLIGRRCSQVLYRLRSQWRECEAADKSIAHCKLLKNPRKGRSPTAVVPTLANKDQDASAALGTRFKQFH